MSGGGGTQTATTSNAPPQEFLNAYKNTVDVAGSVASTPYSAYPGQTVAGFSPDQQGAISTISNSGGIAAPYINAAAGHLDAATAPIWGGVQQFSPEAVGRYESPYTNDVVHATEADFNNQNQIAQQGIIGDAIHRGAWGGDRSAVAQGIASGQQTRAQAPILAGLRNAGYAQALQEFNQQQGAELGATQAQRWLDSQAGAGYGNLGQEALGTTLTGANARLGIGGLEQTQAQAELNVPYQQFLARQAYPFQTTGWLANIAEGLGGASGGMSKTTTPGPSVASQVGGAGLATAGVLGLTGAFGNNGWLTSGWGGGGWNTGGGPGGGTGIDYASGVAGGVARGGPIFGRAPGGGIPGIDPSQIDILIVPGAEGYGVDPATHGPMNILKNYGQTSTTTQTGGDSDIGSFLKTIGLIAASVYGGPAGNIAGQAFNKSVHFAPGGIVPFPLHRTRMPGVGIAANDSEPFRHRAAGGIASGVIPSLHGGIAVPHLTVDDSVGIGGGGIGAGQDVPGLADYFARTNAARSFDPPPNLPGLSFRNLTSDHSLPIVPMSPVAPIPQADWNPGGGGGGGGDSEGGQGADGPGGGDGGNGDGGGEGEARGGRIGRDDGGDVPLLEDDTPNPITSPSAYGIPTGGGPSVPGGGISQAPVPSSSGIAAPVDSEAHGNALDPGTTVRAHRVYQGLVERGMDPATALGFAANAVQESRANHATNPGDMGASHGLLQWRGDRLARYVSLHGHAPEKGDLNEQLDYIIHEVKGPEARAWQAIQSAPQNPAARAAAVSEFYERPKDTLAEIRRRASIANQLAARFSGTAQGGGIAEFADGGDVDQEDLPLPPIPPEDNGLPVPPIPPLGMGNGIGPSVPPTTQGTQQAPDEPENPRLSPWKTLTNVGLGIMGGASPHAGVNIGKGALTGVALSDKEQQTLETAALRRDQAKTNAIWRQAQGVLAGARAKHIPVMEEQKDRQLDQTGAVAAARTEYLRWKQDHGDATLEQQQAKQAEINRRNGVREDQGQQTIDQRGAIAERRDTTQNRAITARQEAAAEATKLRREAMQGARDERERAAIQKASIDQIRAANTVVANSKNALGVATKSLAQALGEVTRSLPATAPMRAAPSAPVTPSAPKAAPILRYDASGNLIPAP